MRRLASALLFLAGVAALWGARAEAVLPPEGPAANLEIRAPAVEAWSFGRFVRAEEGIDAELDLFQMRAGGVWAVQRDPLSGTPHQLVGSGVAYYDGAIGREADAASIAASFLAEYADLLRIDPGRLGESRATLALGKWAVLFGETYEGIPVRGGRAHVVMTENGRIYAIGSDFHTGITLDPRPSLAAAEAVAIAGGPLAFVDGRDRVETPELVVYPERREDQFFYRLAWRVEMEMDDPLGRWETWVDAHTGEIFGRENLYEFVDVVGTATSETDDPDYCEGIYVLGVQGANVNLVGGPSASTDTSGDFVLSNAGTDSVDFWTRLFGDDWNVDNMASLDARDTVRVMPGVPFQFTWNDGNSHRAERDGWYHAYVVRNFIKTLDPSFTGLDYRMRVRVNRNDGYCPGNAWWDGQGINFCEESGGYANTAEIGDVVYHEYGHGVTQHLYTSSGYDGAISEGNSDVISLMVLKNSMLGKGFTQDICDMGIRSANNTLLYPDDLTGEGHHDGQLISGFFWELRSNLITTYGVDVADSILVPLWHFSRKAGQPSNMQDQVTWVFLYDDNDGNLDTGTPNFPDLELAATTKGFSPPVVSAGVQITHGGLASTTDTVSSRTVSALVEGLSSGINPSTVKLYYRLDGGVFTQEPMTPTATPDEYEGTLPAAPRNTRVEYYLEGADSSGHWNWSPGNAPTALYSYDVVFHYDPCESLGAWTLGDSTDDATNGLWINGEPIGTATRPEYDATPDPGENCFVTGNAGNVNDGKTTLYSPIFDLTGESGVVIRYVRWYSNDFQAWGPLSGRDDDWFVDVSNDGGETWTTAEQTNEGTESWIEAEIALDSLFSPIGQVQLRFIAQDYGGPTRIHAAVDELRILVSAGISTGIAAADVGALPARLALAQNRPNPFNPLTALSYEIPAAGKVVLAIYSVGGRRVRTLVDETMTPGAYRAVWDGTDDAGRAVGSGVYFYRLESGGGVVHRKMTLLR